MHFDSTNDRPSSQDRERAGACDDAHERRDGYRVGPRHGSARRQHVAPGGHARLLGEGVDAPAAKPCWTIRRTLASLTLPVDEPGKGE